MLKEIDFDRENELSAKRILYHSLLKKLNLTTSDKEILIALSKDPDLKLLTDSYIKGAKEYISEHGSENIAENYIIIIDGNNLGK